MTPLEQIVLDDQAAREVIRDSLDESLIVEASAGTGKTYELVQRIVAMLAAGRAQIDQIVAVTFTRKAAGELKLRLRQELDRARRSANLDDALARLEEARIGTIHSFCADILRERPVEAVVDPAFEEISEVEAPRLYRRAFGRWLEHRLAEPSPALRRALSRLSVEDASNGTPVERLCDAGYKLVEWRDFDAPWSRPPFDRETEIDRLVDRLKDLARLALRCTRSSDPLKDNLRPAAELASSIQRAEAVRPRDYDLLEGLLLQLPRPLRRNFRKGSGSFGEGVTREEVVLQREQFLTAIDEFRRPANADLAAALHGEMHNLGPAYDAHKRRSGKLDFDDLLILVRDLIVRDESVRRHLQKHITHIFVDEFQDTDPLQLEILILLSADDATVTDWRAVRPVPGKLFLVGDPKQSIYRFRRADIQLYEEAKKSLLTGGARLVNLTHSFRAVRPIQHAVNIAFEPEFSGPGRAYSPLDGHTEAPHTQPSVIALPVPKPFGAREVTKWAVDASLPDAIVAFIDWLIRESGWTVRDPRDPSVRVPVQAGHVCVLFRRLVNWGRDVTREYTRGLEARGIPHLMVGAKSFHEREEVETLRAALAAIEWPDDELSVFATLKGSLFAILDDALLRYRLDAGAFHPYRPAPANAPPELQPVIDALAVLRELHRLRNRRPIVATLHELLETTRAHAGFAMRPSGHQVLANVYRVCDLARAYESGGGISFRGFVEELAEQAAREESSEAPVFEEGAEGVRMMTVHKAKGLEFPVVILADMSRNLGPEEPERYIDPARKLCATKLLNCSPYELLEHQAEERGHDQAEGIRVAYVAATRARDLLLIPAVGDEPMKGPLWLEPLNKAIYPKREQRRTSKWAPGCPRFGETTVLEGPGGDPNTNFAIKPGLHFIEGRAAGLNAGINVVWWDPGALKLKAEGVPGLRAQELLAEDEGGASKQSTVLHDEWRAERNAVIAAGVAPSFDLFTPTTAVDRPVGLATVIRSEGLPKPKDRPAGRRFGALVHAILRDAPLDAGEAALTEVATLHRRVLGASDAEADAARALVAAALAHPLIGRARRAERCHREYPIIAETPDGKLVEGVLDLAFQENGRWTIVDFKTDADAAQNRARYERQLEWYVYAMSRLGPVAEAWLLSL